MAGHDVGEAGCRRPASLRNGTELLAVLRPPARDPSADQGSAIHQAPYSLGTFTDYGPLECELVMPGLMCMAPSLTTILALVLPSSRGMTNVSLAFLINFSNVFKT